MKNSKYNAFKHLLFLLGQLQNIHHHPDKVVQRLSNLALIAIEIWIWDK